MLQDKPARPPVIYEYALSVIGIDKDTVNEMLKEYFIKFGEVEAVFHMQPRPTAVVAFKEESSLLKALEAGPSHVVSVLNQ